MFFPTLYALAFLSALATFGSVRPASTTTSTISTIRTSTISITVSTGTTSLKPTSVTASAPAATTICKVEYISPPISASTAGTAVYGLQLGSPSGTSLVTSTAILKTKGFAQGWNYAYGGFGVEDECNYFWLNIGNSTVSYKPLTWDFDNQISRNWVVAANGTVSATATSQYGATSNFLACETGVNQWALYLQTGTDGPPSAIACATTQLRLGTLANLR
ncbi:hypothetical protein FRB93_008220 [Tulasnella sp. JGI-2019a]|nr:hypothetical protein FRB93_008220 [Tulasnella sp. JGI-2019a]